MGRVLVACEFSGVVRQAFRQVGHEAFSCDILPSADFSQYHFQCDVREVLSLKWDLMIAHPLCTFLTNAGVRHLSSHTTSVNGVRAELNGENRVLAMRAAADFFNLLKNYPVPLLCIENPIPHALAKARIGPYSQLLYPWQFGDKNTKPVCLWLKDLPKLEPTLVIGPPDTRRMLPSEKKLWNVSNWVPQSADRWKIRSKFFPGIAAAMAAQWGPLLPPFSGPVSERLASLQEAA